MKIYIVLDSETGESDGIEFIASTLEKAIEVAKTSDQCLSKREILETDLDGNFDKAVVVFRQYAHIDFDVMPPKSIKERVL